jgi:hypothetical protein
MKPRPRIRKFFKWGGLVVSVLLLTFIAISAFFGFAYVSRSGDFPFLQSGRVGHNWSSSSRTFPTSGFDAWRLPKPTLEWWVHWRFMTGGKTVVIPLWPFVTLSLATTATAWRMDIIARRKSRLGGCPACGYDRTGLAPAAPCPECNAKA